MAIGPKQGPMLLIDEHTLEVMDRDPHAQHRFGVQQRLLDLMGQLGWNHMSGHIIIIPNGLILTSQSKKLASRGMVLHRLVRYCFVVPFFFHACMTTGDS
jgi:hypothetical protein